ncbi:glycoside hydrolase superfamily [Mycena galopus ATCC 62051]|nr:glycoside hydrolase superfamily [Mycena galopus ATCC 62051]
MLPSLLVVLCALILVSPAFAASAAEWAHSSIYQLVTDRFAISNDSALPCDTSERTYCGGSWTGIANHLDYIQKMGFDAVWISPIPLNVDNTAYGDGYHGYWSRDISTLSPRFGSAADLKNLSAELHKRDMFIMLDIVVNHMAAPPKTVPENTLDLGLFTFDYTAFLPFRTQEDFHSQCFITDYNNQTDVEQCWLGDGELPLADLDTEVDEVVQMLCDWINVTVQEYGIDGVRIDTVKHIRLDFWANYSDCAGVLTLGEVETDDPTYAALYLGPLGGVLDYPAFYAATNAFATPMGNLSALQDMPALVSLAPASSSSPSTPLLTATFLENHDQPRFPSLTNDTALRMNAMVWPFVGDGMPTLYYGQEQGYEGGADPANREALWLSAYEDTKPGVSMVTTLNTVRKQAIAGNTSFLSTPASWIPQPNPSVLMLSKPPLLTLLTNVGANETQSATAGQPSWSIPANLYKPGMTLVDVLACRAVVVGATGGASSARASGGGGGQGETLVQAQGGMPQVLIPASMLSNAGSGPCPALATGGRSGARKREGSSKMVRAVGVLGTVLGVVAFL